MNRVRGGWVGAWVATLAAAALPAVAAGGAAPADTLGLRTHKAAVAAAAPLARSRVIYSNFDKPPAAFQTGGALVAGPASPDGYGKQFIAVQVPVKANSSMTGLALAVSLDPTGGSQQSAVRVSLLTEVDGAPGSVVQSWQIAQVTKYADDNLSYLVIVPPSPGVPLTGGTNYWIAVDTDAGSDFYGTWSADANSKATATWAYFNDTFGTWKVLSSTPPVLAVYGQPR